MDGFTAFPAGGSTPRPVATHVNVVFRGHLPQAYGSRFVTATFRAVHAETTELALPAGP